MPRPLQHKTKWRVSEALAETGLTLLGVTDGATLARHATAAARLPYRAAVLIAGSNTFLWGKRDALPTTRNPLDDYAESTVRHICLSVGLEPMLELGPHDTVNIRGLLEDSGLATPTPTGLSIHREYGLWFGVRRIVAVAATVQPHYVAGPTPCQQCETRPCIQATERTIAKIGPPTLENARENWRDWDAVRRTCPYRARLAYCENQSEYHHTQSQDALRRH